MLVRGGKVVEHLCLNLWRVSFETVDEGRACKCSRCGDFAQERVEIDEIAREGGFLGGMQDT